MSDLTALPESIVAGTTVEYTLSLPDYPASAGWTLKLYLAGISTLAKDAVASGDDFTVTLIDGDTGNLAPGVYQFAHRVAMAGKTYQVECGSVTVEPNIGTAADGDLASWEEQALTAVRAAIKGGLSRGMAEFQILGRAVKYFTPRELRETELWLSRKVAARQGRASGLGRQHRISFAPREE